MLKLFLTCYFWPLKSPKGQNPQISAQNDPCGTWGHPKHAPSAKKTLVIEENFLLLCPFCSEESNY